MAAPPPDPGRRLGERIPIGDVFLTWRAQEDTDRNKKRSKRGPEVGRLLNISVSGGAVVAPVARDIGAGSVVIVQLGNALAAVRIKRVEEFGEDDWRIYGVEFVETDPSFLDWINHLLDGRRNSGLLDSWNHAH
jgi:hypothetical protein